MDVVGNAHPKSLDKEHFVAGNGANTITKHFFAQNPNLETKTNFFLKKISVEGRDSPHFSTKKYNPNIPNIHAISGALITLTLSTEFSI